MLLSLLSRRSLEVDSRDAYGFALRPQHIQGYREYSSIYKEEEEERSTKWKDFLEHQDKSVLFHPSAEKFCEESQAVTTEEKEEAVLQRGRVGDDSGCNISDCDVSTECNTEKEVQLSKGPKEEVQLLELPDKEEQLSERPDKKFQLADDHRKQVQLSQESAKDGIHSKATKTNKIQTWAQVRPSVHVIENMMSYHLKRRDKMKEEHITASGDHLPSINETGSSGADTVETAEDFDDVTVKKSEDNVDFSKESEDDADVSLEEHAVGKMVSSKTLFSWKEELESLVHGGVPKDLRGEVWQAFVGVKARHMESYYQDLLAIEADVCESKEHSNSFGVPRKFQKQIEKDIPRTFPGHPALDEDGRDSLRRLLIAYALHNPAVGYCQAMNFFAGILLLLMPEENAFWTFVGIMDDYFDGYYTEEMIESQVDQLVFEELMGEGFPKLVNHLDYLGVQVAWISGPWFLSIFVNMLPWESVLRVWDVLLFEGNRVMLFRTALALMELYGPALLTTKDAGDAITLLQSLAGSTFDSSQLVFTACMGFLAVTENRLEELREKHRPAVLLVIEERQKQGRVWKDSKGLASKLYSFKHDSGVEEVLNSVESDGVLADGEKSRPETCSSVSSNIDELLSGLTVDSEVDSLPDLQEQVVWLKVELCRSLEEKRSAVLRAEELETALVEIVKQDNRRELSARIEHLELEVAELRQALADKREQEAAMLQVLMRVEQEQRITEDARLIAEKDAAAQRYAVHMLEEKYEKAEAQLAQMEKRVVMAESMLEATLQYQSGQARVQSSPGSVRNQSSAVESPRRKTGLLPFGLGWRDKNKGKPINAEDSGDKSVNDEKYSNSMLKGTNNQKKETP